MKLEAVIASAVAVSIFAGCSVKNGDAFESKRSALLARSRPVVYNTDGCDMLYYPTNLPLSVEAFCGMRLDYSKGPVIGTISYCPVSSGFSHFTATKAGDLFSGSVLSSPPSARNATLEFRDKIKTDSLQMAVDFCRREGKEIFVGIRVNDTHDANGTYGKYLFPPFKKAHPECLMGTASNKPPHCSWTAVDFAHEAVREHMRKFVREFVENYDLDGIEYDFMRHAQLFKTVAWGGRATAAECDMMSALMRDLRAITEAEGRRRGRPILVVVRTPDSLPYAKAIGMDVERWMSDRSLDIWVGSGYFQLEQWTKAVEVARRHGVKFYASIDESRIPNTAKRRKLPIIPGRQTIEFYHARFAAALALGCDGVYVFNLERKSLKDYLADDPRDLAGRNKIYFATERASGGYRAWHYLEGGRDFWNMAQIDPGEPRKMAAGETYAFEIAIGEDFAKAAAAGKKAEVTVLAQTGLKAEAPLAVRMNGRDLSGATFKNGLFSFKVDASQVVKGLNRFEVKMPAATTFNDFAVKVDYRP